MQACQICHNRDDNRAFIAREMMFGMRDPFKYVECGRCGCLQIVEIPEDMEKYYPSDYYAFARTTRPGGLRSFLKRRQGRHAAGRRSWIGALVVRRYGVPQPIVWARRAGVDFGDAILDVGSGRGARLLDFESLGFTNLTGVDPYIEGDIELSPNARVRRTTLDALAGTFDFVMLHHSFEHVSDPAGAMQHVARLLAPGGTVLLRTPVAGTHAWRTYGADWVQLDAPRHAFVHTPQSIAILAEASGLDVAEVVYDSESFQFWASEQYKRDIPLHDERSYRSGNTSMFSEEDIRRYERLASQLNAAGDGDQAAFYLKRKGAIRSAS